MVKLKLDDTAVAEEPRRVNWGLAVTVVLAIVGWLIAGTAGAFGDYRKLGDRVTTLETQRTEDLRRGQEQRADDTRWKERIENKIDVLLQREAKK